jgi:hypothetical protein
VVLPLHAAVVQENGGYALQVPKGSYRLEVELRAGETLMSIVPG